MLEGSSSPCHLRLAFTNIMLLLSLTSLGDCLRNMGEVGALYGNSFDVLSYGAVGDGSRDDTQAFGAAWEAACSSTGTVTLTVPQGKTFLVGPSAFRGPCTASTVHVQVNGGIVAPASAAAWGRTDKKTWLGFYSVNGLVIDGQGTIDGQGPVWWAESCKTKPQNHCTDIPMALRLEGCSNVVLMGITIVNSPKFHVFIESDHVHVSGIHISSPGDSPNTDGIHVQSAKYVSVDNCYIESGDDCISISTGTSDVNITRITCGPGHGISIGSLGKDGSEDIVERIHVNYVNFTGTTNGVRIKTWQGGSGYARNIIFEQIGFNNVSNPILIDQYYCDAPHPCQNKTTAVKVSDVRYIGLRGTSTTDVSIKLACSQSSPCTGIVIDDVNLVETATGKPASSYCYNAQTSSQGTVQPALSCSS